MEYINQWDYPDLSYPHPEGIYTDKIPMVSNTGCGLCSMWMVVRLLTEHRPTIEDMVRVAQESGGNNCRGTRISRFGPYCARLYGMRFALTNDKDLLKAHLQAGKPAIICVDGDKNGEIGLFSHVGHYIVALSWEGDTVCVMDPAMQPGKYEEGSRKGKVRTDEAPLLYVSAQDLLDDAVNSLVPFSLFSKA